MKWSQFNVLAQKESESRCLLFNTFHDSQVLCDDKNQIAALKNKIETHGRLTDEENELAETLSELGFITDDQTDERAEFLGWFEEKIRNNYEQISSLILTSRTCNLRCPYCFEKDVLDRGLNMTVETADQVIRWNQARIDRHRPKKMDITFFGGEPLMNVPVLEKIASEMHVYCQERGVEFEFGMITNGVMLTKKLVERIKPWGLKWVKITLDGDKHEHDQLRVTPSGKGSFDRIWANLESVKSLVPVYIGGNFNQVNQESLHRLVDRLSEAPFRENIFAAEFKPVQENFDGNRKESSIRTDLAEPAFNPEQIEIMMDARSYIRSKGLPSNNQVGIGPCELHRKSFFGIDMNGKLYKCSAMVGRDEFASGDIWEGEDSVKVVERMGEGIRPWKDCGDCAFIPVCAGGCKAVGYDRTGDFTVGSCDKKYFKRMVGEMFERNLHETAAYGDGLDVTQASLGVGTPDPESEALQVSGTFGANREDAESFAV